MSVATAWVCSKMHAKNLLYIFYVQNECLHTCIPTMATVIQINQYAWYTWHASYDYQISCIPSMYVYRMNVYIPTTATVVQINQYGTGTSIQTGTGTSIQNGTGTSIQNGIGTVQHSSVQLSPSHLRAGITSIITVHQQAGTHLTISFGANGPKITSQSCPESTAYDPYRSELAMTTHYTHGEIHFIYDVMFIYDII